MSADTGLLSSDTSAGADANASQYNNLRADAKKMRQEDLTAGETISGATLPVPVYQDPSDNEFYKADASDVDKLEFVGFAITDGTDGNDITIQHNGVVGGFSSLEEGSKYYLQDTAGTIDTTYGTYKILVGIAISTTQILIMKEPRPDLQWLSQDLDLSRSSGTSEQWYQGDSCFSENKEYFYLMIYYYNGSGYSVNIKAYAKDKVTGQYNYSTSVTLSNVNYGGITSEGDYVYLAYYNVSSSQKITRYDLDLTNATDMSISSGVTQETGIMTNVGSTYYILNSNTYGSFGVYTRSGTTFTRTGSITVTGLSIYNNFCFSDGDYIYLSTTTADMNTYSLYFNAQSISKVDIAGGARANTNILSGGNIFGGTKYDNNEFVIIKNIVGFNSSSGYADYGKGLLIKRFSMDTL